jgi:hypothetical protein
MKYFRINVIQLRIIWYIGIVIIFFSSGLDFFPNPILVLVSLLIYTYFWKKNNKNENVFLRIKITPPRISDTKEKIFSHFFGISFGIILAIFTFFVSYLAMAIIVGSLFRFFHFNEFIYSTMLFSTSIVISLYVFFYSWNRLYKANN